jgi:transposase
MRLRFSVIRPEFGGERAATLYTIIETAKLNGLDPEAYLPDLVRIASDRARRSRKLLPWNITL